MGRILIVDDEPSVRRVLAVTLAGTGHEIVEAGGIADAKAAIATSSFDLVLTDQQMTDGEGLALLNEVRETDPSLSVVMITAYATVELAVEAMRRGAFDFLPKPFDHENVRAVVARALEHTELLRENENLRGTVRRMRSGDRLIGESATMGRLHELIGRVAPTAATVLVTGETGTGKELVARAIHEASPRARHAFVAVNCAAFAETLLDDELFGHERGAFTGADRARQGVFEMAHRGTLFLDEAGEMTLPLQAKLLRVLVDGLVSRIGSSRSRQVDVRVLVATHRNLEEYVRSGRFRGDLYFRLAVVPILVPPLREHLEDLPLLLDHFRQTVAQELKVPPRPISAAARQRLASYPFPGNVRELRNVVERAYILARGPEIEPHDLMLPEWGPMAHRRETPIPGETAGLGWTADLASAGGGATGAAWAAAGAAGATWGPPGAAGAGDADVGGPVALSGTRSGTGGPQDLRGALEQLECRMLRDALEASGGVQAQAARLLGISRSDMSYKLKKHGIESE